MCFPEKAMRITKATLPTLVLPVGKTDHIIWDERLPGYGCRIRQGSRRRTYLVQYRSAGATKRIKIGADDRLDPDQAFKEAKRILARVQLGGDPQDDRAEARAKAARTFGREIERYLAQAEKKLKRSTFAEVTRYLRKAWEPLHNSALDGRGRIERADIAARLNQIAADNGRVAATRARAHLSAFYGWALGEGLAPDNPVLGTNRPVEESALKRDRVLAPDELGAIWHAAGVGDYGDIVRLLILTGQRREEVAGMRWSEINGDWLIPRGRTKNGIAHAVPLTDFARDILNARYRADGRELVFGSGEGGYSGWSKAKGALDRRIANSLDTPLTPWRLHDIRRTFATRLADCDVMPHVVEALLNHVSTGHKSGVAGVYNRAQYAAEKRAAMERWSAFVRELVSKP